MLTIWIIPFPVMVFSYFPVLVNEKSNLQIRIGYFAFLPSLDISENPTKKQGKPKFNPTWIFDFFSSVFSRISEVGPNRKLIPSTPRLSFWTV